MSDIKSVPKPAKIFQVSCNEEVKASVEAEVARTGETVAGYFKRLHHENLDRLAVPPTAPIDP